MDPCSRLRQSRSIKTSSSNRSLPPIGMRTPVRHGGSIQAHTVDSLSRSVSPMSRSSEGRAGQQLRRGRRHRSRPPGSPMTAGPAPGGREAVHDRHEVEKAPLHREGCDVGGATPARPVDCRFVGQERERSSPPCRTAGLRAPPGPHPTHRAHRPPHPLPVRLVVDEVARGGRTGEARPRQAEPVDERPGGGEVASAGDLPEVGHGPCRDARAMPIHGYGGPGLGRSGILGGPRGIVEVRRDDPRRPQPVADEIDHVHRLPLPLGAARADRAQWAARA